MLGLEPHFRGGQHLARGLEPLRRRPADAARIRRGRWRRRAAASARKFATCCSMASAAVLLAAERGLHRLELYLCGRNRLQVRLKLRRQRALVLPAVRFHRLFLLDEPAACIFQLGVEELARRVSQHRAVFQVLLDEERGQPLGHEHRRPAVVDSKPTLNELASLLLRRLAPMTWTLMSFERICSMTSSMIMSLRSRS